MNVFELLLGPMAVREMRLEVYRSRHLLFRLVVGGLLAFFILISAWPTLGNRGEVNAQFAMQQYASLAGNLVETVKGLQACVVWILLPIYLCPVFAGEQEATTIALLSASPLSTTNIVLGKTVGRLMPVFLLLLLPIPVLALVGLFGGLDYGHMGRFYFSLSLTALFISSISVFTSAIRPTVLSSLALTMMIMGVLLVLIDFGISRLTPLPDWFWAIPFAHLMLTAGGNSTGIAFWFMPLPGVMLSLVLFGLSISILHRRRAHGGIVERRARRGRWRLTPVKRFLGLVPIDNPVWVRARRSRIWDADGMFWWAQVVVCLTGWGIVIAENFSNWAGGRQVFQLWDYEQNLYGVLVLLTSVLLLSAIYLGALGLQLDRRSGMLESMMDTPLTRFEIATGTFGAVMEHLGPLILLPMLMGSTVGLVILLLDPIYFDIHAAPLSAAAWEGAASHWVHPDRWFEYAVIAGWCLVAFILGRWRRLASLFLVATIVAACFYRPTSAGAFLILAAMLFAWLGIAISCKARTINEALIQVTFALVWMIFVPMLFATTLGSVAMALVFVGFYVVVVGLARRWLPVWGHTLSVATIALLSSFSCQFVTLLSMPWGTTYENFSGLGPIALVTRYQDHFVASLIPIVLLTSLPLVAGLTIARFNRWNERAEPRGTFGVVDEVVMPASA